MTPAPVEVSEEHREAAHRLAVTCGFGLMGCFHHGLNCQAIARAFAERDAAAELRGRRDMWLEAVAHLREWADLFKPEPDVWKAIGQLENLREDDWPFGYQAAAAIRARSGKP